MSEDGAAIDKRLRAAAAFSRRALELFYRRIEVVGADKVPLDGPLLVVGNHGSGLVDPALFLGYLPRRPRFLALSTLWNNYALKPLLALGAAIPVYQRRHGPGSAEKNRAVFERCYQVLAAGGVIGLFPEGRSHHEPALAEIKTGAARIALETLARHPHLRIRIVPVGLSFEEKTRFRSRALVTVGEPFEPLAALEAAGFGDSAPPELEAGSADPEAVRALTAALRDALLEVTLNYPSWREARLIERAVAIYERPTPRPPAEPDLARSFRVRQLFIDGYAELRSSAPRELDALRRQVAEYDAELELYRLRDEHVVADYPPDLVRRFTFESLWMLLVHLPLGVVGTGLNTVPFLACRQAARLAPKVDEVATYKIVSGLLFYPLAWLLQGLAAGWLLGAPWGAVVTLLGPLSGLYALRLHQHGDSFLRHARAFLLFRGSSRRLAGLRRRRSRLLASVRTLAARLGEPAEGHLEEPLEERSGGRSPAPEPLA